ncbi:MAG: metal ABC transporter permease [Chloroflexota bacterium]
MPEPLAYEFMQNAYLVGTIVAIVAAAVGYFVVLRGLSFAAHALSHIGFAGAAGAVLIGLTPLAGMLVFCLVAALAMGAIGERLQGRDVAVGIVLAFSLGLGVLFLTLYTGYAGEAISILFGTILGVSLHDVTATAVLGAAVLIGLAITFRPLLFASVAEEVAIARGLPVRTLSSAFLLLVAVAVAVAVQVVGVLLIFTLLIAPAATATYLTTHVYRGILAAVVIAVLETWLGITLAYYTVYPVSFYIATAAVVAYGLARMSAHYGLTGVDRSRGITHVHRHAA